MMINRSKSISTLTAALVLLGLAAMLAPDIAEARGRGGRARGGPSPSFSIGLYSSPFYSSYYSPYYSPYYARAAALYGYPLQGGMNLTTARLIGVGALDLNVRQGKAEVWVDGAFAGQARDFDGTPAYLWLKEGVHRVAIRKAGFQTYEQDVRVGLGTVTRVKLRLAPGDSEAMPGEAGTPAP